jgi:hypothetical protein
MHVEESTGVSHYAKVAELVFASVAESIKDKKNE